MKGAAVLWATGVFCRHLPVFAGARHLASNLLKDSAYLPSGLQQRPENCGGRAPSRKSILIERGATARHERLLCKPTAEVYSKQPEIMQGKRAKAAELEINSALQGMGMCYSAAAAT